MPELVKEVWDELNGLAPVYGGSSNEPVTPVKQGKMTPVEYLNAVLAGMNLPGKIELSGANSRTYLWTIDKAWRFLNFCGKDDIAAALRDGRLTADLTLFTKNSGGRAAPLDQEPAADADLDEYTKDELWDIYRNVKRQKDALALEVEELKAKLAAYEGMGA